MRLNRPTRDYRLAILALSELLNSRVSVISIVNGPTNRGRAYRKSPIDLYVRYYKHENAPGLAEGVVKLSKL